MCRAGNADWQSAQHKESCTYDTATRNKERTLTEGRQMTSACNRHRESRKHARKKYKKSIAGIAHMRKKW